MGQQRLIQAIGRIERALSRLEQAPPQSGNADTAGLADKHARLKAETQAAISELDKILERQAR